MKRGWRIALGAAAGAVGVGIGAHLVGKYFFDKQIDREIDTLLRDTATGPREAITEDDIDQLPDPVQRYLRFAGVVGRYPIRSARVTHRGDIRASADARWMPFEAVQYYSAAPPAFVWHADVKTAPLVSMDVRDYYLRGRGEITGRLASVVPVVHESGPEIDQGSGLRLLSELIWVPTAFLEPYITWEAIDERRARVSMKHWDGEISAIFGFGDDGRVEMIVGDRYRSVDGHYHKAKWSTPIADYMEVDGFMVPTGGSGVWHLDTGAFEYVRLNVLTVNFGVTDQLETDDQDTKRLHATG